MVALPFSLPADRPPGVRVRHLTPIPRRGDGGTFPASVTCRPPSRGNFTSAGITCRLQAIGLGFVRSPSLFAPLLGEFFGVITESKCRNPGWVLHFVRKVWRDGPRFALATVIAVGTSPPTAVTKHMQCIFSRDFSSVCWGTNLLVLIPDRYF